MLKSKVVRAPVPRVKSAERGPSYQHASLYVLRKYPIC